MKSYNSKNIRLLQRNLIKVDFITHMEDYILLTPKTSDLREEMMELKQISLEINAKLDKLLQLYENQNVDGKKIGKHNNDLKETVYNRFSY